MTLSQVVTPSLILTGPNHVSLPCTRGWVAVKEALTVTPSLSSFFLSFGVEI